MAALAIAKVPYEKWLKFVWKLVALTFIITLGLLVLAMFVYK
ncbi:hypothetical protein [Clostridium senegalense]